MKRSDFFIKLTTAVLFIAVVSYIGIYLYISARDIFVTATAISYVIEETFPANGYIVRAETVVTDAGEATLPMVGEGVRVGKGQAFAVEYMNPEALEAASEIRDLRLRIAQLESSIGGGLVETEGFASVMDLSKSVHSGDFSSLDELSLRVETYVFTASHNPGQDLPAMLARLDSLERRSAGMRTIYAPVSGIFSQTVDGFEHISPAALSEIRPSGLTELFETPARAAGSVKLVTAFKWYYAAVMDAADAARLPIGRNISLQFAAPYHATVEMLIESVGRREDGECVVLFSSDRGVHNVTMPRHLQAEVIFDAVSGIRVPKEAMHLDDDGVVFVFIRTGVRAERVNVEVLLEFGDSYLVRDGTETGTPLRPGSTIIVRGNNLIDGRVIA